MCMIKNMSFVYSLSCDNSVFYIGMTKDIAVRYLAHINSHKGRKPSPVAKHIGLLLENNKQIALNIISYLPTDKASKKEADLIHDFTCAGHHILNEQHALFSYKTRWRECKSIKETVSYLKLLQYLKEDTHCCLNHLDYEQTTGDNRTDTYSRLRKNFLQSAGLPSDSSIYI